MSSPFFALAVVKAYYTPAQRKYKRLLHGAKSKLCWLYYICGQPEQKTQVQQKWYGMSVVFTT